MAECGSFSRNLSRDFEVIYAKYSQSFDGCPEFYLNEFDHHIEEVECVRVSVCEQLSVLQPNNDSSSHDSCLPNSSFSSDDDNYGLITYHKDDETSQICTTPLGSLVSDEDSTSSSSNESDIGWESDCSGPTEDYPSTTSETQVEIYPSPLKAVSSNPSPNNHGSYNSLCPNTTTCVSDKAFLSGYNNKLTCAQTKEHGNKTRQSRGKMAVWEKSSDFCNVDVGSCQNKAMCSTLLAAVNEFRNIVANFLAMSQGNHRLSQRHTFPNLGSSEKCDDPEKCLAKSSPNFHGDNESVGDKERENGQENSKSRKSFDFQPTAFVVEKIFARPKGLSGESFVEVASRNSLNTPAASFTSLNKSLRNSRFDNHRVHRIPLSSTEASDEGMSSPGVSSPGVSSPGVSTPGVNSPSGKSPGVRWLCTPLRDVDGNELRSSTRRHSIRLRGSPFGNNESKSDDIMMSPSLGRNNSFEVQLVESPKVIRDSVAWKQTFSVEGNKRNTDCVKPLPTTEMAHENRVISPSNRNLKGTTRSPPFQGCFPSDEMNQPPKSSFTRSPLSILCQDKGDAFPVFESRTTGRRSVPLRATPGSNNMRLSDATLGLSHRTSTPVKRSPDRETFFEQKKIHRNKPESPTPRHSSHRHSTTKDYTPELSPTDPTTEHSTTGHSIPGYTIPSITGHSTHSLSTTVHSTHGYSTPSPIRQLTSSKRDELDNGSTLDGQRVRGLLEGSNRSRLYSPGGHLPRVGKTSEVQSTVPLQVDETGRSGQASLQTPQGFRLVRKRFEDTATSRPVSSSDDSSRGKSLKMKNTPRRNSTGFHPYKYSPVRRKQTSALESPLKSLRTLSSASSCDDAAQWSSIRHSSGNSPSKYGHTHEETRPSNKNLQSDAFKKKHALLQIEDSDAVHSTIRHSSGKRPEKYGHAPEERQPSMKNLQPGVFKKKCEDPTTKVNENCSKGNCTKRFCFDCSMDCS